MFLSGKLFVKTCEEDYLVRHHICTRIPWRLITPETRSYDGYCQVKWLIRGWGEQSKQLYWAIVTYGIDDLACWLLMILWLMCCQHI